MTELEFVDELRKDPRESHGPTREELAHEVERLRTLMNAQDMRIIRLLAELKLHERPRGFVNAKKRRKLEQRAVKSAITEVLR